MPRPNPRLLTPTDLANHLACAHRTQLERLRHTNQLRVPFAPDARLEAMIQRGAQHERAYLDRLRAKNLHLVDLTGSRDPDATLAAMHKGADAIVQAPLRNHTFFGIADVLLRVDPPSALGNHTYEPVDTKLATETKAGALLQLLTYCELLHSTQGTFPAQFHVVTPLAEETYRTADFAAYFRVVRDHLRSAVAATPPPATYPEPVPHCDICAYWQFCAERRRTDDHPALIAGATRGQIRELQRQSLPTLAAFAEAGGLPAAPERGSRDTYDRLAHQARLQLQARTTGSVPIDPLPIEPNRGLCRLPEPSPGDVFLDFEGDPFVGVGGLEYLTGFGSGTAETFAYTQLWALDRAAEKQALVTLLDTLQARLAAHPGLHVYHFGAYEVAALRRLCSRHDTHGEVLDRLLRGERFVDLHRVVKESLRIGVASYGLKELEPVIGFARQLDLRAAGVARRDLELALELGTGTIPEDQRSLVAAYNQDDCRATAALRAFLEQRRAQALAAGAAVPRPELRDGEASAPVAAAEARCQALREALLQGLPKAAERTAEQQAQALLAELVGYFRREAKSDWWEHFRLRELPPEERLGEREVLAELRFVGIEPKQGRERAVRCAYEFPPQDTAIEVGKRVYVLRDEDPTNVGVGTVLGTVVDIDHDARRVVIRHKQDTAELRPTAVFRDQIVPNEVLEEGLLAFAEHVRDHGLPTAGPYARAADLLLRRPPRQVGGRPGAPLQQPGEDVLTAALRLCRGLGGGVLPVQGPPGTGKSYTGGRTLAALAAHHRVGIAAVSHKVIDNLLLAARDGALAAGQALRLVHKHEGEAADGIEYLSDNQQALDAIGPGCVVGGTAWLWARPEAEARLDYLFVDEAGQMSLAQLLAIARCAHNLVLLGDPQQLEQPQQGAHPDGADIAALAHLIGGQHTLRPDQGLFLPETWRLHPALCAFTSELFYDGRLQPHPGNAQLGLQGTDGFDGAGHFLHLCAHEGNQAVAHEEVAAVVELVGRLLRPGATWTDRRGQRQVLGPEQVLVIAPYNAQVVALQRALRGVGVTRVGTVDKFQGQEAPVVVYSCTSSSPEDAPRGLAFLYDPHRLNVASSRAQCAFVMVAAPRLFAPEVRGPEPMRWANGWCRFRELATVVGRG